MDFKITHLLLITIFFVSCAHSSNLSSIGSSPIKDEYTNLQMDLPDNWEKNESDRSLNYVLKPKNINLNNNSVLIEIFHTDDKHNEARTIFDVLDSEKKRVSLWYKGITYSEPSVSTSCDLTILKFSYEIPMDQIDESSHNASQFGVFSSEENQPVLARIIRTNEGKNLISHVYLGNGEDLNKQAEDILDSIEAKIICD